MEQLGDGSRTIEHELHELRGVFPNISLEDFEIRDNGNIAVTVYYETKDHGTFKIRIEFMHDYPYSTPFAYVLEPEIRENKHMYPQEKNQICFIEPSEWRDNYTTYDTAMMISTWVWSYCRWLDTGVWDWDQKDH